MKEQTKYVAARVCATAALVLVMLVPAPVRAQDSLRLDDIYERVTTTPRAIAANALASAAVARIRSAKRNMRT